jgi:hypothetical protein
MTGRYSLQAVPVRDLAADVSRASDGAGGELPRERSTVQSPVYTGHPGGSRPGGTLPQ